MKIAVIFDNFGPYHAARIAAIGELCDVLAIQVHAKSDTYDWERPRSSAPSVSYVTLFKGFSGNKDKTARLVGLQIRSVLEEHNLDVVAIPGWSSPVSREVLKWGYQANTPVIVMSASQEKDYQRYLVKELVKKRLLQLCDGAICGGVYQKEYLARLEFPISRIVTKYNVVDNEFFEGRTKSLRSEGRDNSHHPLPKRYILTVARLVDKKNLEFLLLVLHRLNAKTGPAQDIHLVVLGNGPNMTKLKALSKSMKIQDKVHFKGFQQYENLPAFYAFADVFILPSLSEQWGLTVNEAMASGLPVMVSKNCGCRADLVGHGVNGYVFDPVNISEVVYHLEMIIGDSKLRKEMSIASALRVRDWSPQHFAENLKRLSDLVLRDRRPKKFYNYVLLLWISKLLNLKTMFAR